MSRYYRKNAYYKVSRSGHLGVQLAEHETPENKANTAGSNCQVQEQEGRKFCKCGIVLKDTRKYIIINAINVQALCFGCYHR